LRRSRFFGNNISLELLIEHLDLACNLSEIALGESGPKLKVIGIREVHFIVQRDDPGFEGLGVLAFSSIVEFEPAISKR